MEEDPAREEQSNGAAAQRRKGLQLEEQMDSEGDENCLFVRLEEQRIGRQAQREFSTTSDGGKFPFIRPLGVAPSTAARRSHKMSCPSPPNSIHD